jgi:hypothetical protein
MDMKITAIVALGALGLAAMAPQASAADNGFYLGVGVTDTNFDLKNAGSESLDDNSFKVIAGIRPLDWLAFEANYIDLGSDSNGGASVDAQAITVSALALAEFGIVDIYGRVGMANWKVDASLNGLGSNSENGWEPTFGAGVGVHFGSIGVRAEYETFNSDFLDADVNTVSVSVTYTFL